MKSLNDEERKEVLGEVLADELKVIGKYVKDIPKVKEEVHQVHAAVDDINERLIVLEHVMKSHEVDIRYLKHKTA
jgi:ubiquinone biosynthesis protein UbiJ